VEKRSVVVKALLSSPKGREMEEIDAETLADFIMIIKKISSCKNE
jgi:hypothetical protein